MTSDLVNLKKKNNYKVRSGIVTVLWREQYMDGKLRDHAAQK